MKGWIGRRLSNQYMSHGFSIKCVLFDLNREIFIPLRSGTKAYHAKFFLSLHAPVRNYLSTQIRKERLEKDVRVLLG
jgi:hypothetical protein